MVSLQIISKILTTHDISLIEDNLLDESYFLGYESEYKFIKDHYEMYGNVPDTATFLSTFPQIDLVEVTESDTYLLDKVREEHLYSQAVPILQQAAKILQTDSNSAVEFMMREVRTLEPNYHLGGTDIVAQAEKRFEQFQERKSHPENFFFESGFKELDEIIRGIQREEEYFVIFARTNQGKSWILAKMCSHVWQTGFNVGYFSPEMTDSKIGFRFDTLISHYKNRSLLWGKDDVDEKSYKDYIDGLKSKNNRFIVATPSDFGNCLTVSKLKNWIKQYKLDMVAIDGITYVSDERGRRNDNKTTSLTNISEDLMELSVEMHVPILVVVQANRGGVMEENDGTPELESIRDSDGISHNASKVISIRQKKDNVLEIGIKKNRDGLVGGKLNYHWDIDTGDFQYIPSFDDAKSSDSSEVKKSNQKQYKKDKTDVF